MKSAPVLLTIVLIILVLGSSAQGFSDTIQIEWVTVVPGIDHSFSVYGYLDQPHTGFEIPLAFSSYDLVFDSATLDDGIVPTEYEISWRIREDSTHFLLYIFPLTVTPPFPDILPPGGKICEVYFHVRDFAFDQIVFVDTAGYPLFVDESLLQYFDLSGYDTTGTAIYPDFMYGTVSIFTDVYDDDDSEGSVPEDFRLYQNYPNPFNPTTRISYQLPYETDVTLEILNLLGQKIETIEQGIRQPGYYEIFFDGSELKSGFYLYRIRAGDFTETRKMLLLK
ncbi:MAG TPA: T9SS type A sorting domain-containing protein [candidate division Zixibacteria bacterium]|nr:T9SS type A sorting domain-containing protein [candidate division Zixibacteria bacterium]